MKAMLRKLRITTPAFIKIAAVCLLSVSLFFGFKHFSSPVVVGPSVLLSQLPFFSSTPTPTPTPTSSLPPPPSPPPLPPPHQVPAVVVPVVERTGIIDENGAMTDDFVIGEFDLSLIETVLTNNNDSFKDSVGGDGDMDKAFKVGIGKYQVCNASMTDYIPCLDNTEAISQLNSTERGEKFERHCPEKGRELDCVVPRPEGYKIRVPWPQSRDEVWFDNVPHTRLVEDKGGQNWITRKDDKFIFPGGGTQFIHGADQYLDQISKMVPDISFGKNIRVALDVGCGVASFGAFLSGRNVTALSIAPKDQHENQIQFALERGVSAMVALFATQRLVYPSQAFDFIHCSRCRVNWTRDDGILLLEANRILRAGGYFVWAAQPVYKHKDDLQEQWKEMQNLTRRICWELVKKEGYIAIWRKPLTNSCYLSRDSGAQPPLCDADDDPDDVWYVGLKACITQLPNNGYGANVTTWPARLHHSPDRLFSIKMDAFNSRKEIYKAESKYWNDIVEGYVKAFRLKEYKLRNIMDMRAGYGGFAAAMHDFQIDCWVMNVVPVSGSNTLPVIYDRGLIGVMHDWCEPFDTYPRTYDMLNAAGLFSIEQKRCNISTIMLDMDRILRPGGRAYIRDTTSVINELQQIGNAMGWVTFLFDTGEGPYANWKLLTCEKRL